MRQSKRMAVWGFSLAVLCGAPDAQSQTRSGIIESARTEKEATLKPYTLPKDERIIIKVQDSLPYRLLTGDAKGFGVSFGNTMPGSGFTLGPSYTRSLWESKLILRADAKAGINQSYGGRVELLFPRLFTERTFLTFSTQFRNWGGPLT